ncbi:MAG: LamG domain-containing protein, partial [Kiritimatiellaeota bacterium]|nr:LamG domain-containing protein [Kiritimatiellota bacterium]
MKRFIILGGLALVGFAAAAQNVVYHLDASAQESLAVEGGGVAVWRDADGRAVAFAQDAAGARPAFNPDAFGGRGGVAFGGKRSTCLATDFSAPMQTVFIVARISPGPDHGSVWGQKGGDDGLRTEKSTTCWRYPGASGDFPGTRGNGNVGRLFVNGIQQEANAETRGEAHVVTAVSAVPINWPSALGNYREPSGNDKRYFCGDIAEVLVYDSALPTDVREGIEARLSAKWGIARASNLTGARLALARRLADINCEAVALALADMAKQWPADCKAPAWLATLAADRDALLVRLNDDSDNKACGDAEQFADRVRAALLNLPMLRDAH